MELNASVSAVITGGASGLGAATARALAAHGVRVALFDLNAISRTLSEMMLSQVGDGGAAAPPPAEEKAD